MPPTMPLIWMMAVAAAPGGPAVRLVHPGVRLSPPATLVVDDHTVDAFRAAASARLAVDVVFADAVVPLVLTRFDVTRDGTRVELGGAPFVFDGAGVTLYRCHAAGHHAFLAVTARGVVGHLRLAGSSARIDVRSRSVWPRPLPATASPPSPAEDPPWCGVAAASASGRRRATTSPGSPPVHPRLLELAVDTDHLYYRLFNDPDDALAYLIVLYGAVSDVLERDVGVRLVLTYVRLWPVPGPTPPGGIPDAVHRDIIQSVSGSPSIGSVGGIGQLCTGDIASQVAQIGGHFDSAGLAGQHWWDLYIVAHELGHNLGSPHTHCLDPPVDTCATCSGFGPVAATRGTLMSYCILRPGGLTNHDLRYHVRAVETMHAALLDADCIGTDCNANGVDDDDDLALGSSVDANGNGVPDECDDCDANGVLDDADIAGGAADVDGNGVPDVCQPDCNGNGRPDADDLARGVVADADGDGLPDLCAEDCDADGVSDTLQIAADMTLDRDRDVRLDTCQDCDGDGVTDAEHLGGAHDLWVASDEMGELRRFHGRSGVWVASSLGAALSGARDMRTTPDGDVLVATADRVVRFDRHGAWIDDLIAPGSAGMSGPQALLVRESEVWVAHRPANGGGVLAFDRHTGAFARVVVPAAGGFAGLAGMAIGPNGHLFLLHANRVSEVDPATGAALGLFVAPGSGGLSMASRDLLFKSDGNLLVASHLSDAILEFDGRSGAYIGVFNRNGQFLRRPWGLRVGPTGSVFVAGHAESGNQEFRILEYEARTGHWYRHSHVIGAESGLMAPTGFDFVSGDGVDCNANRVPDDCEMAADPAVDADGNGVPDTCEIDCNGNGRPDRLDILPFGLLLDCDFNGVPDTCELGQSDCNANGVHDACETRWGDVPDCNANGVPDSCEVHPDCNANTVPDVCEPDLDFDQTIDACDDDDDNDGRPDSADPAPADPTVCGDSDGDSCDDCARPVDGLGPLPDADPSADGPDADGDGACDAGDPCPSDPLNDADGDGVCGPLDACPGFDDQLDGDGDGIPDGCDNCADHPNARQADCDGDGLGDVCTLALELDDDRNFNGVPDACEPALVPTLSRTGMIVLLALLGGLIVTRRIRRIAPR